MSQISQEPMFIGQELLKRGFRQWFLYIFQIVNGSPWKEENIHKKMFKQLQECINGNCTRLNFNLSPRSGKTTMSIYLVVYALTVNPKAQIIYTSFNQDLLSQISQQVAAIMQHPVYQAMYPQNRTFKEEVVEVDPVNEFWKDYLIETTGKIKFSSRKILTPQGGVVLFNSIGSAITGFGAGTRNAKGFSGFLVCFPYDEYVWTENGREKIGDIVETKKNTRVWSFNIKTGRMELKPVVNWIKNPGDDLLEVSYMGHSFRCTPDHKVFTLNRGYVPAKNLCVDDIPACPADSFDLTHGKPGFVRDYFPPHASVHNQIKNFFGQSRLLADKIMNALRKTLKTAPGFDCADGARISMIFLGNRGDTIVTLTDCDDIGTGKIRARKNKSSDSNRIPHVFAFGAISKIFKSIVGGNRIKMPNFHTGRAGANKRFHNSAMDPHTFDFRFFGRAKCIVSALQTKIQNFFRNDIPLLPRVNCSVFASNAPKVRNTIPSFVSDNRSPLLVRKVGHIDKSYCITVGDNHNFVVGEKQGFIVKNCDDVDKPTDVRSETIRNKTHTYFVETLLTRLNNPNVPIINIQQRLHIDDMSGFLEKEYGFITFKAPLLDENGNCNLGNQYTPERIKELQINNYVFQAQYQQNPIPLGGGVIKHEYYRYYKDAHDQPYRRIFMTADTANKTKEWNDYTAIMVFGLTQNRRLRLLDMVHAKLEIPELQATFETLWNKWHAGIGSCRCSAIYIEDKASGTQVIQMLRRKGGLPIMPVIPEKDKLTRVLDVIPQIAAGNVELPESDRHPISAEFLAESDAFSADGSHLHDDMCFVADTKIATLFGYKNIQDVKKGDWIITPVGLRRCVASGKTGIKSTISKFGLNATQNHKVFYGDKFERLGKLTTIKRCSILSLKDLVTWAYKKQLFLTGKHIDSWGREDIIYLNQQAMRGGGVRKDFMSRFGSFIRARKFRRALSFTTKTIMYLITILIIWSVFRVANTLKCTLRGQRTTNCIKRKNGKNTSTAYGNRPSNGTKVLRDTFGMSNTDLKPQKKPKSPEKHESVNIVEKSLCVSKQKSNDFVQKGVQTSLKREMQDAVYNITVENAGCYYANDILVSNCDAMVMGINQAYSQKGYF